MTKTERLRPLMPKATAVWLIENTAITFEQIALSCDLHILEVQALADQQNGGMLQGENPVLSGQLAVEEIARCEQDESAILNFQNPIGTLLLKQRKERRYMPRAYRQDRPDAIAWMVKQYPGLSDNKICKLLSTTSKTVAAVREKVRSNSASLAPRHPVLVGLCTEPQLQEAVAALQKSETPSE